MAILPKKMVTLNGLRKKSRNTYLAALKSGYFPFPDTLNIVVSHQQIENKWGEKVLITNKPPKEIKETKPKYSSITLQSD